MLESSALLTLKNLRVAYDTPDGTVTAVQGVDLSVSASECVGIVGESGSGKSQTCLSIMGLTAGNAHVEGQALYRNQDLLTMSPAQLRALRGNRISMIFQDPLTCLTPHKTIGAQMTEVLRIHKGQTMADALRRCVELLELVRIPEAARRLVQYPHELSGGMRQRVMIAMALLGDPDLLIADEPTTALDVTVQAQVLHILADLKKDCNMGLILITHDMGVVAKMCDHVAVMHQGVIVEDGPVEDIFYRPQEAYTKMLLAAMPRLDQVSPPKGRPVLAKVPPDAPILLDVHQIKVQYPIKAPGGLFGKTLYLRAVDGIDLTLRAGETLGVVGESGCGKSTLARAILQFAPIKKDHKESTPVTWMGADLTRLHKRDIRRLRSDFQVVFQDPVAALNPRMTIGSIINEPLTVHKPEMKKAARESAVLEMLQRVELPAEMINRYPHELSGGQNQRVGIARAMILRPKMVICDEAVSALDVSIQAQIIDLLIKLQHEFGMAMIFISHDLSVVKEISHKVMVLYLGRVMELADREVIYREARHPYTKLLISAVPVPDPALERSKPRFALEGDLPSPLDPNASLRFMKSKLTKAHKGEPYRPKLVEVTPGHFVAEFDSVDISA